MAAYGLVMTEAFWERRPQHMPLGKLIPWVGTAISRYYNDVVAEHDLTPTSMGVLGMVAAKDGMSHRELADCLRLTPATLTPVVDSLERDGAVRRSRDPADRRVVRLHLTKVGELRLGAAAGVVVAAFRARMPRPTPEHEEIIRGYLTAVLAALSDEQAPPVAADPPPGIEEIA